MKDCRYPLPFGASLHRFRVPRSTAFGRFHRAAAGGLWLGARWYLHAPRLIAPRWPKADDVR